ncbi:MAG TPA: DUF4398 domain-containing protein, partial [Polyangiaceae bacterium]|nr:DUF4398 domain-containing protein [Polyangiaceae bacterium]
MTRRDRRAPGARVAYTYTHLASLALLATSLGACAPVPAPRELTEARAAYQRAQTAATDAPVELDQARRALAAAERRFQEIGAEPEVSSLAFDFVFFPMLLTANYYTSNRTPALN